MSLSSNNNGKNHSPCYALKAKILNARPVDAKRCRSNPTIVALKQAPYGQPGCVAKERVSKTPDAKDSAA